jgi:hypothetical protein
MAKARAGAGGSPRPEWTICTAHRKGMPPQNGCPSQDGTTSTRHPGSQNSKLGASQCRELTVPDVEKRGDPAYSP